MTSPFSKLIEDDVIVIDSDGDDIGGTNTDSATEILRENSPSILSHEDVSYSNFENGRTARVCKLEPTECSSAQYLERTHPTSSCADEIFHRGTEVPQDTIEELDTTYGCDETQSINQGPQLVTKMNGTTTGSDVVRAPVNKKIRKRKLISPDGHHSVPVKRPLPTIKRELSSSKRPKTSVVPDNSVTVGSRTKNASEMLQSLSQCTPVSVIKSIGGRLSNTTSPDVTSATECGQTQDNSNVLPIPHNGNVGDSDFPVSSTPVRPQRTLPMPRVCLSSSNNLIPDSTGVKDEASHCNTVRRKRKLCKSLDLDTSKDNCITSQKDMKLPNFLDSSIIFSHTKKNSRTQLCFVIQQQAQGFALPHDYILELVQEMMMANSPSKRDIMYNTLWSDSERFPHSINKEFLNLLFTTIIDSLMSTKYHHIENANLALSYLLNIFCTDWKRSTLESSSYIATFLSTKIRQLCCEIRKFYERPEHLFCPHVASMLQQLVCLPLAVIRQPQRLLEFSQSMFNEVFVELSRDKQKIFLKNLSSPYLTTQLIATQLTHDYVCSENRELLWSNHLVDSNWINTLLMLVSPYLSDGREDLVHMVWLVTQLLAEFVQHQRGGVVLCAPICVTNPLLTIESDTLLQCTGYMEDLLDRLNEDEVLCNTSLFTPEVCYYMKLMQALIEEKTTSKFDVWL